jgi:hypothetical protein
MIKGQGLAEQINCQTPARFVLWQAKRSAFCLRSVNVLIQRLVTRGLREIFSRGIFEVHKPVAAG